MKNILNLMFVLAATPAMAAGDGWMTDYEAAKKKAAAEKKDLLIDFTGSDWCHWCKKLKSEVFDQKEFLPGVKDQFVLVELDFPNKSKLSDKLKKQNDGLRKKYGVRGYPTIILADAQGRPYAQTGYQKDGAPAYLKHLAELSKKKAARDEAFQKAADGKGKEKSKALEAALKALPAGSLISFYGKEFKQLDQKSEFVVGLKKAKRDGELREHFSSLYKDKKFDQILKDVKAKSKGLKGEELQQMIMYGVQAHIEKDDFAGAQKAFDEARKAAPDTQLGKRIPSFKKQVEAMEQRKKEMAKNPKGKRTPNPKRTPKTRPAKKAGPVVSRPVAAVADISKLKEELVKLTKEHTAMVQAQQEQMKKLEAQRKAAVEKKAAMLKQIKDAQAALEAAQGAAAKHDAELKKSAAAAAKAIADGQRKLKASETRLKTLGEVVAHHEEMERRKRDIAELEKKAAELQKQAEEMKKKAAALKNPQPKKK